MKKYEFEINKVPVEINSYLDEVYLEKNELIKSILKQTKPNQEIGWGGFIKKDYFKKFLERKIQSEEEIKNKSITLSQEEIIKETKESLNKCSSFLEKKLSIFILPTYSKFISEKMNGSGGINTWKNVFFIQISPFENKEKQKESIQHTVAHELGHALSKEHRIQNIFRMLKEEGLNEHFREEIIGGGRDPWTKAISKKESVKIFKEVKEKIKSGKKITYLELFHGKGEYPRWAGYTIGYYLIENYLKKLKGKPDWKKLFETPSKEIINQIDLK
jgi:uncharacterized protein YjaZ